VLRIPTTRGASPLSDEETDRRESTEEENTVSRRILKNRGRKRGLFDTWKLASAQQRKKVMLPRPLNADPNSFNISRWQAPVGNLGSPAALILGGRTGIAESKYESGNNHGMRRRVNCFLFSFYVVDVDIIVIIMHWSRVRKQK